MLVVGAGARFVVGATELAAGGDADTGAGPTRGYALLVETPAESVVGAAEPAGGGGVAIDAEATEGQLVFTVLCEEAGSNREYRPILARWRSIAANVLAVIVSIVDCIEKAEATLGAGGAGGR